VKWEINGDRPIWIQLKEQMARQMIAINGEYQSGDKLPSVRDLAKEAGVNPNTMQRALVALDQEGLIVTNRTTGRSVTEDQDKIREYREQIAEAVVYDFIYEMQNLGYSIEDIQMIIARKIKNSSYNKTESSEN
jgi:DNA-binding transcriptional regulator YhcF (GntR family)